MRIAEFEQYVTEAIRAFQSLREIIREVPHMWQSRPQDELDAPRERAAAAIGHIDHLLTRYSNRVIGPNHVDLFRLAMQAEADDDEDVLRDAIMELRLSLASLRRLAQDHPDLTLEELPTNEA